MPEQGATQQRYRTPAEAAEEALSLEKKLLEVSEKRLDFLIAQARAQTTLIETIKQKRKEVADSLSEEQNLQKKVMEAQQNVVKGEDKEKIHLEGILKEHTDRLKQQKLTTAALQAALDKELIILDIEQKMRDLEKEKLENVQMYLGKFGEVFDLHRKHYDILKKIEIFEEASLIRAAAFLAVLEQVVKKFLEFDKATTKFRIDFGILRQDSTSMYETFRQIGQEFAAVGVKIEDAADAAEALGNEFGGVAKTSKDLVETAGLFKAQLGVAQESSAGFLRNISAISKSTAQSNVNMAYVASSLSAAAGVPLNMVMQDVAKFSGNALALVSRMPIQMVKTAVAAREMGTTVNRMADSSAQLLNFTENVTAEMEASVLVGQAINLQKARELAYHRDIEGSTREILRIAKQIDFQNLDFFQMQAFAAATGRSVDELMKMIQAQRQLQEAKGIEGLKDEVAQYERLKGLRESDLKNAALQREETVKTMANQERTLALQQQWNQLLMETSKLMFPIVSGILQGLTFLVKYGPALASLGGLVVLFDMMIAKFIPLESAAVSFYVEIRKPFELLAKFFPKIGVWISTLLTKFGFAASVISKLSFLGPFLRVLPIIGYVITAIQFLISWWTHFRELAKDHNWFVAGFYAIGLAVYDVLLKPFVDLYKWIKKHLGAHSPSEIGLAIVKGIVGVGTMLYDALTSPFRRGFAWILDHVPGMGGLAERLRGGMTGALRDGGVLEKKAAQVDILQQPTTIAAGPVAATPTTPVAVDSTPDQKKQDDKDSGTMAEILKAINLLNSNLMAGRIGVYIDGQLMSATIARQTLFKGGYGVNQAKIA